MAIKNYDCTVKVYLSYIARMQWLKSTKTASRWKPSIFAIHAASFTGVSVVVAQNNHKCPLIGSFYLSVVKM